MSDPEQHFDSAEIWAQYCEAIKLAGRQLLRPETPKDPFNQAEGLRYLSRLVRLGLEMYVESGDMSFPSFMVPSHETAKIIADNPDNYYQVARIDGRHDYRVRGSRGTVAYLNFSTKRGGYDSGGKLELSGFIDAKGMSFEPDGQFELVLSQKPRPGNWLKLDPDSSQLLVRQTFLDRIHEKPAQLRIERMDTAARPPPLDPRTLRENLRKAGTFVDGTARLSGDWAHSYRGHTNQLPPADQAHCQAAGGDPNIFFYHSYWRLAPEEALVIHFPRVAVCDYWNIQVNNYWMESLDYRYFRICINKHSAQLDSDGGLTLILAHADPGHPNWLETAGHEQGTMCFRWINSQEQVHPETRVVKLAQWASERQRSRSTLEVIAT
jgi:Protein of unknown function (DUF1214)